MHTLTDMTLSTPENPWPCLSAQYAEDEAVTRARLLIEDGTTDAMFDALVALEEALGEEILPDDRYLRGQKSILRIGAAEARVIEDLRRYEADAHERGVKRFFLWR